MGHAMLALISWWPDAIPYPQELPPVFYGPNMFKGIGSTTKACLVVIVNARDDSVTFDSLNCCSNLGS